MAEATEASLHSEKFSCVNDTESKVCSSRKLNHEAKKDADFHVVIISPTFLELYQSSIFCKKSVILTRRFIRL